MKEEFSAWYPRTTDQLASLWTQAVFVPDTNVLLHCLRHASEVREELLRILEILSESLWIPYQVGLEFHRNRLDVEVAAVDAYDRLVRDYESALSQVKEKLRQLRSHPGINVEREVGALDAFLDDFKTRMEQSKSAHPSEALSNTVTRLTALFQGRVGPKPTSEQMTAYKKDGEDRYAKKIPPGYKDTKKDSSDIDKYGDLIIWKEMIDKAKADQRPVVFISDDAKEDWWSLHRGRKLGPRPELLEEFRYFSGQDFHIYELGQFLRVAAERDTSIAPDSVNQIEKSVLEDREVRMFDAIQSRMDALESERERLISMLSGVPSVEGPRSEEEKDKARLRLRLSELDAELRLNRSET